MNQELKYLVLINLYSNEVDALFDFNGKKNTYKFDITGSEVVKIIKEQCGDEWFIPSLGELISAIHCRDEINNLLFHVENSYNLSESTHKWTSSMYDQYSAYIYLGNCCSLFSNDLCIENTVTPITLLPEGAPHSEIEKTEAFKTSTNEIHLSNSNELLVEINNDNTSIKIYR